MAQIKNYINFFFRPTTNKKFVRSLIASKFIIFLTNSKLATCKYYYNNSLCYILDKIVYASYTILYIYTHTRLIVVLFASSYFIHFFFKNA